MSKHLKILLAEGNARQVLPMAKALRQLGHEVTTFNSSKFDFGYASRYPHHKLICYSNPKDEKGTLESILTVIKDNKYDLIIPMNDDMAILLSKHKNEILKHCHVAVNDWHVFQLSMDKLKTMQVCMDHDIPCPASVSSLEEYNRLKDRFSFPVVVKPRVGCGAVGFHVAEDENDLISYYKSASEKFGPCLIQEYIPQTDLQYKAEFYIDRNGELKSAIVFAKLRWYPIDGGSSTLNATVDRPDIIESGIKLLKEIGWRGYADIDLIQDPRNNVAKIIEINPRITGSVKICFKAGINFARQIVEDTLNEPVSSQFEYKKNTYLRYFQKDVLWFLKSKDRFKTKPSWFSFRNTTDQIFSLDDPLPFLALSVEGFAKLRQDSKKRKG